MSIKFHLKSHWLIGQYRWLLCQFTISTSNFKIQIQIGGQFYLMVCWRSWQHDTDFRGCEVGLWLQFFRKSIQINTNFDKASPQGKWKIFNSTNLLSVTVPRVNQSYNFNWACNLSQILRFKFLIDSFWTFSNNLTAHAQICMIRLKSFEHSNKKNP